MRLPRFAIVIVFPALVLVGYLIWRSTSAHSGPDPVYVAATPEQETAIGLHAAPLLAARYGGLYSDPQHQLTLDYVTGRLSATKGVGALPHVVEFYVLADSETVNAFSLPGGQIFVTRALFERLGYEPARIAAVFAHQIGHVMSRHATEFLARTQIDNGLTGAAVLASYDPEDQENRNRAVVATTIARLIAVEHTEEEEIEADQRAVEVLGVAGFDVTALADVLEVLAGGDTQRSSPFATTHPLTARRLQLLPAGDAGLRDDSAS